MRRATDRDVARDRRGSSRPPGPPMQKGWASARRHPVSQVRDETLQGEAALSSAGERSIAERVSLVLRGLLGRVERATDKVAAGAARGRGRAAEAAGGLRRSAPLRHGLAAGERGNLEAALALLHEAAELTPEDSEAVLALWNVALSCERPEVAAPALLRWIHAEASGGRRDLATAHWMELVERVPDERADAATLVRLMPELRSRVAEAHGANARSEAEAFLLRALRQCVDSKAHGLTPGLALRVFEQARFLDAETARRAGEFVLQSSDVHETKRQRVKTLLEQLDAGETPAGEDPAAETAARPQAPSRQTIEVTPVELSEGGLIVRETGGGGRRARVDLRSVEAICVSRVDGLGPQPVLLIDLVLRRAPRARKRGVYRMRADAFDPAAVLPNVVAGDDALRALLGALLDGSGAVPLPDPDSALGIEPRHYGSLEEYEDAVFSRLAAG